MPFPANAQRILVAGVSGVGKTTLARRISEERDLPWTELDSLHHGPGWTRLETFEAKVAEIAEGERWVSEWQYSQVRPLLAARADLLIWLDLPTAVTMGRVIRRTVGRSITREVLWNGNREPGVWHALTAREGIIRWAWQTRDNWRKLVPQVEGPTVIRLRSQREVDQLFD